MKILEVIPQLSSGGGERFTVDLCNELAQRHEVLLIVLHSLDQVGFYTKELSQQVTVVSMNKKFGVDLLLPFRLFRTMMQFKPDIVHTHLRGIVYSFPTILFLRNYVYCHTVHTTADKEAGSFISRIIRKFLFKSHKSIPITISEESRHSFIQFYGMDAPMIFNGRNVPKDLKVSAEVETELRGYRHTSRTRLLVNLARVMEVKRQGLIARVCRRLYDEGYDFTMLFIGRFDMSPDVVREVNEANCPVAHLLGERHNPLEYLKAADAYCLMSSYEGMPISLIEAFATAAVPVCTPVGGIVDVVQDGVNGILAKDLSEESCYVALKRFLDMSSEDLKCMKLKVLKSYLPFTMSECARKYEQLFKEYSNK